MCALSQKWFLVRKCSQIQEKKKNGPILEKMMQIGATNGDQYSHLLSVGQYYA